MDSYPTTQAEAALNTYFAVQLFRGEDPRKLAGDICTAGHQSNTLFRRMETLDTFPLAGQTFLRCRSDVLNPYPMLDSLLIQKRGYVAAKSDGSYGVHLADGRSGPVQGATMHMVPRGNSYRETYKGPGLKFWDRQFTPE